MEFSYFQTENFEMEKLSSDTGYFKKPVKINRGVTKYVGLFKIFINYLYLQTWMEKI